MPKKTALAILVLSIVTVVLAVGAFVFFSRRPASTPPTVVPPVTIETMRSDWAGGVLEQTASLKSDASPEEIKRVRDTVFGMRVTSADRDAHLAIVVALIAWEKGEEGAYSKLQSELAKLKK